LIERPIEVQSRGVRLVGTLCLPAEQGPFPIVLMVHGSGPVDRDENMNGQKLDVFNTLAHGLAKGGIASVRYDKRGCGASQGDYYTAGLQELVDDVTCWFDALERDARVRPDRILLLGHSEGCLIAARVSSSRTQTAGLALLCPFAQPTEDILLSQAAHIERELAAKTGLSGAVIKLATSIMGRPVANQRKLIQKLKSTSQPSLRVGLQRLPAKCLRELLSADPAQAYAGARCPLLLVGGEKDLQCDPADVARIAALAAGPVESHVVPNLTHLLRRDEQPPTILGAARLLTQPVDGEVVSLVVKWAQARAAS
jgi:pimeloyl-ACP methyl ester carboxylesterase